MPQSFYTQVPTYAHTQRIVAWLTEHYPELHVFPIGKSVLGRNINALSIGNPMGATLFVGAVHGLEWLTCLLLLRFCENLLEALRNGGEISEINLQKAMQNRSLVIVPCLNPDGVEIALCGKAGALELGEEVARICNRDYSRWQANAHGVDLNHNFDAGWNTLKELELASGINAPAPRRYGGEYPHSEPESEAAVTFCMTYRPHALYAFHSQGEEIYYSYGAKTPKRSRAIAQILSASSGYAVAKPTGLASHGGLKDWFVEQFQLPGFTIEVGLGKNPLGLAMLDGIYQKIEEMLIIATLL